MRLSNNMDIVNGCVHCWDGDMRMHEIVCSIRVETEWLLVKNKWDCDRCDGVLNESEFCIKWMNNDNPIEVLTAFPINDYIQQCMHCSGRLVTHRGLLKTTIGDFDIPRWIINSVPKLTGDGRVHPKQPRTCYRSGRLNKHKSILQIPTLMSENRKN